MAERISKQDKGLLVLMQLLDGRKDVSELMLATGLEYPKVHQGVAWLRDYDENCLVVERDGRRQFYKLAEDPDEVLDYQSGRARILGKQAERLEKMVANATEQWPKDRALRMMHRHLVRLREDLADIDA